MEDIDSAMKELELRDPNADRLHSPFIVNAPNSKMADEIGLSDGDLITKYADDAVILIKVRDDLQREVDSLVKRAPGTTLGITHFKNWGQTKDSLLLHIKPSLVEHVVAVVKSVKALNEKKEMKVLHSMLQKLCLCVMGITESQL